VAGLKIWPSKRGRPSASTPICLPVRSAPKSPRPEGVDRRRVPEALGGAGAKPRPVGVGEEERPVLDDGPAQRRPPALVVERTFGRRKEALGVERVVGQIAVGAPAQAVRARLGGVLDEAAARVTVLGGVGRADDPDLLDGLHGGSALLAPLVPGGVTEGSAVEEVLRGPDLAPVDAGAELASPEGRVAVRAHGKVSGLHLEHRLGQADVGAGDDGEVVVVLLVDPVADVGPSDVEGLAAGDFNRLRYLADLEHDVVAEYVSGAELDPGDHGLLEPADADGDGIGAEDQRSAGVGAGIIGCVDALDAGGFVPDGD
jgi:hypothetical protein